MAKLITKVKNKTIKAKELKWLRILLKRVLMSEVKLNDVRASYKGKGEWIKVSFWCKVKRIDKEGKVNGSKKAKKPNS